MEITSVETLTTLFPCSKLKMNTLTPISDDPKQASSESKCENESRSKCVDNLSMYTAEHTEPLIGSTLRARMTMQSCFLGKGQDQGYMGSAKDRLTGEVFDYIEIFDGHGENDCIEAIRGMDHASLLSNTPYPEFEYQDRLSSMGSSISIRSGSTYCLAKIFSNRIECTSVGDSQLMIFINRVCRYQTTIHNGENAVELERLGEKCYTIPDTRYEVLKSSTMALVKSVRLCFNNSTLRLCPSQSLGHHNMTGLVPERHVIDFEPTDTVRVVAGSDGLWDMIIREGVSEAETDIVPLLNFSASELVDFARQRWEQSWSIVDHAKPGSAPESGQFGPNQRDDIVVCVWDKPNDELKSHGASYAIPFAITTSRPVFGPEPPPLSTQTPSLKSSCSIPAAITTSRPVFGPEPPPLSAQTPSLKSSYTIPAAITTSRPVFGPEPPPLSTQTPSSPSAEL